MRRRSGFRANTTGHTIEPGCVSDGQWRSSRSSACDAAALRAGSPAGSNPANAARPAVAQAAKSNSALPAALRSSACGRAWHSSRTSRTSAAVSGRLLLGDGGVDVVPDRLRPGRRRRLGLGAHRLRPRAQLLGERIERRLVGDAPGEERLAVARDRVDRLPPLPALLRVAAARREAGVVLPAKRLALDERGGAPAAAG